MPSAAIAARRQPRRRSRPRSATRPARSCAPSSSASRHAAYLVRKSAAGAREILGSAEREQYERGLADALAAHCR